MHTMTNRAEGSGILLKRREVFAFGVVMVVAVWKAVSLVLKIILTTFGGRN